MPFGMRSSPVENRSSYIDTSGRMRGLFNRTSSRLAPTVTPVLNIFCHLLSLIISQAPNIYPEPLDDAEA
jgi:hypothetical protein